MAGFRTHLKALIIKRATITGEIATQEEIEAATGVSQSTLSRWSKGTINQLDYKTVIKLMDYFDCEFHELITVDRSSAGD